MARRRMLQIVILSKVGWICFACTRLNRRDYLLIGLAQRTAELIVLVVADRKMILDIAFSVEKAHYRSGVPLGA